MIDVTSLLPVLGAFFVVAASPGPATLACASVAMRQGRRAGLSFAVGLTLGLAFWGVIAATGLGTLLVNSAHALAFLKVTGGLYLLWLAYRSGRSAMRPHASDVRIAGQGRWLWRGAALNLSNPKAVLAWLAVLALGATGATSAGQIAIMTLLCSATGLMIYAGYAVLFSTGPAMGLYARLSRWVDGLVAGLFGIAGFALLRSGLSGR